MDKKNIQEVSNDNPVLFYYHYYQLLAWSMDLKENIWTKNITIQISAIALTSTEDLLPLKAFSPISFTRQRMCGL